MSCLFEAWNDKSAPVRHSSAYWPHINEAAIQDFINGSSDAPELSDRGNVRLLQDDLKRVSEFLTEIEASSAHCKDEYVRYEKRRIAEFKRIEAALLQGENDALTLLEPDVVAVANAHLQATGRGDDLHTCPTHPNLPQLDEFIDAKEKIRTISQEFLESLLDSQSDTDKKIVSATVIKDRMEAALRTALGTHNWSVRLVPAATNTYIDHASKTINIPSGKTFVSRRTNGLIAHEIGAHIVRAQRGNTSHEKLAGVGMSGYSEVEEALGAVFEQIIAGTNDFAGLFTPFIVLVAQAASGDTFRTVYDAVYLYLRSIIPDNVDNATVKHGAFTRCQRFMRLGTNKIVDVSGTKYATGMAQLITYTKSTKSLKIEDILAGKYDLNNTTQLELLHTAH